MRPGSRSASFASTPPKVRIESGQSRLPSRGKLQVEGSYFRVAGKGAFFRMATREVSIPGEITPARSRVSIEWPTLLLIVAVYAGWLLATAAYGHGSAWLLVPVLTVLVTLHGSLQHEIVHNHPTRWNSVNKLLAIVPLS